MTPTEMNKNHQQYFQDGRTGLQQKHTSLNPLCYQQSSISLDCLEKSAISETQHESRTPAYDRLCESGRSFLSLTKEEQQLVLEEIRENFCSNCCCPRGDGGQQPIIVEFENLEYDGGDEQKWLDNIVMRVHRGSPPTIDNLLYAYRDEHRLDDGSIREQIHIG